MRPLLPQGLEVIFEEVAEVTAAAAVVAILEFQTHELIDAADRHRAERSKTITAA